MKPNRIRNITATAVVALLLFAAVAFAANYYVVIQDFADGSWRSWTVSVNADPICRGPITFSGPGPNEARSAPLPDVPRCEGGIQYPTYP